MESEIAEALSKSDLPIMDGIDREDIPKAVLVLQNRRKIITDVTLSSKGELLLHFENEGILQCPTNADIVDWQWCLNYSGKDPYAGEYELACLAEGNVVIPS